MKTLEKSEKSLKQAIYEKGLLSEAEKNELKKLLSYEKVKADRMQALANEIKEECNRKSALLMQDILNKDETIKKLTATVFRSQITKDLLKNHQDLKLPSKLLLTKDLETTTELLSQRTQEKLELDKSSENKENKELPSKQRTKSYSASNNNKTKSFLDEKNEKTVKVEPKKLDNSKRAESRLKNMRKGSVYEKENLRLAMSNCGKLGSAVNIRQNLSMRTINEIALSVKNN